MIYRRIKTFAMVIGLVLVLQLIVVVESGSDGASIKSIGDGLWYGLVTLTTVGYGDLYPVTAAGKFLAIIYLVSSLGLLGLFVGKCTEFFTNMRERKKMGHTGTDFENHIVVIGWNDFSRLVIDELVHAKKSVVIILDDLNKLELVKDLYHNHSFFALYSDFNNFDLIEKTNMRKASKVFVNLEDDTKKLVYVLNLKKCFGDLDIVVTLENSDLKDTFNMAGIKSVLPKNNLVSKLVASYIFEPDVAAYNEDLITSTKKDSDMDIQEYRVLSDNPYNGSDYHDLFFKLKEKYNAILLGVARTENGGRLMIKNPTEKVTIKTDDYLILIVNGASEKEIQDDFAIHEGVF